MRRSLLVVLVLLLTGGFATAADYIRIDADSLVGGTVGALPFYITRECPDPEKIQGTSNGFVMTASGSATWSFNSHAPDPIVYTWFDMGGLIFTNKIDGTSPDSFLTGGAAINLGLPVVTEQLYFTINLDLGLGGGELCIDSSFIMPAGTWKFSGLTCGLGGAPNRPLFLAKDGSDANHPICITVVGEAVCPDPLITPIPGGDALTGSHCAGLNFTFVADPGEGETIAAWTVTSGPGTIDAGGNYSVGATATGTYPVVVEVENGCGNTDDYAFNLDFTNANPAYTNTGGEDNTIVAALQYSYDFNADDADGCDNLTWSINSQSPPPTNPATISAAGLFSWQTDLADAPQSFDFQIQVTDGITKGATTYDFSVLVTEPVCTVPTVNVTPPGDLLEGSHCYVSFQFGADPGDFGQDPATIAGWAVTSGPGSIDGTGLYTVSNSTAAGFLVTIEVTNSCGETDDYVFSVNFFNDPAEFTNDGSEPTTVSAGGLYSFDFDASESDTCDADPVFNITDASPAPINPASLDPNTGLFAWQSDASEGNQTFSFTIAIYDEGLGDLSDFHSFSVEVSELVCTAPTIIMTPASDLLEGSHCAVSFQFGALPGQLGDDPATIAGWAVTTGPGSIDGAGLYTVSNSTEGAWTVDIEVTNSCGQTDPYSFGLTLTTADPAFTNAEEAPDTACADATYSYDFDATDPDPCDNVVFACNSGTPTPVNPRSINSTTGLFEWQPDPSEIGTVFQFEVWANDEGLAPPKSDAMYLLEITVLSCVQEEPEITLIHGLLDFEMVVGDPDPAGQELQIANTGTGTLNWELANDSSWLVPTETSGSAPPTSSLMLNINSAGRPVGSYRDTVFVTGNAFNSPQYAVVDLEITEVPVGDESAVWVGSASGIPGEDVVIPVTFKNTQELSMIVLPLQFWGLDKVTNGITLNSVSFTGSRVDYIALKAFTIDNVTQTVSVGVFVTTEPLIPADSGLMANLHFSIDPTATPGIVPIDSTHIVPVSLAFGDAVGDPIYPDFSLGQIEILPPPMPCVELSDSNFTFTGYECGPDPDPQYFDILNCGDVPISWEIIGQGLLPAGSVSFDPSFGNDDHFGVEISVDIDCLPIGTHYDTACVILTDPDKVPPGFQACIEIEVIITEPPELNIAGEVIDDGTTLPIAGATVELYDFFPSSLLATTTTAGDGTFDFGPYTGNYVVRAYKNGYYQNWVNVTAPDENVQVALTPTDTPKPTQEWVNLYCDWATFEDYAILPGDVVEAFDPTGVLCGQFFVSSEGAYGFMPVYRDDSLTTPALDEGCDPGDAITVKLNGFDMTPFLDSPVSWTTNGDNLEACFDGYIEKEICIHLDSAWNLISWNVDTEDDAIDVVLADIMHLVEVVLGFEQGAMTFDPDLVDFSTLDFTDHFHGYWVKVSDSVTFCLTGLPVDPATPIHLEDGWNLASYLPNDADSTPDALASIYSQLIIALGYDDGGLTWDPANPDPSDLRYLAPGFGYWLKVLGDVDLIYSTAPPAMPVIADNTTVKSGTLSYVTPTRQWVDLYGSRVTVDGVSISTGAVVEAVSEDGAICGAFMVDASGKLGFMPVYGDDAMTRGISEGPTAGGSFHLVVDGIETKETFTWTSHADRVEVGVLNSIGGHGGTLPSAYQLQQNYPNPFNPKTTISYDLGVDAYVTLTIYNILGEAVKVLVDEYQSANNDYTVVWDGTDRNGLVVSSGVYFYRLSAGEFSETKKMMLMK